MKTVIKWVVGVVVLVLVGLLGWKVYERVKVDLAESPASVGGGGRRVAVAVEVTPVTRGTVRDVQVFTGTLSPKASFVVSPKVAGRLERLHVHIGDKVKSGDLIAELDDAEYQQQLEEAQASLEVMKAGVDSADSSLKVSKSEYERTKILHDKNIMSQADLDIADAQYRAKMALWTVARAQVDQKGAALRQAQVRLSYTRIHATWEDGTGPRVVGERFVDEGELLRANDPIVSVLDINVLTAVVHTTERDYSKVLPGQEVILTTDAFPGRSFTGKVARVAPILKETSREARVEIAIPNPDLELKPGMFVRARIEFDRHQDATLVPVTAFVRRDEKQGVFLADTHALKAQFVPVTVGITEGPVAEILTPPLTGTVVTMGQHLLEDQGSIMLPEESSTSQPTTTPDTERRPRP